LGQPACGFTHAHSGGSIVRQIGYWLPPSHALQEQTVPSSYQHCSVASVQLLATVAGAAGHAAGLGATEQLSLGGVMLHAPLLQVP
jgi:hypothetical protein